MWYFIFFILWVVGLSSLKIAWERWRAWRYCQPARYVADVKSLRYYQSLGPEEFTLLILESLKAHGYTLLGNCMLGVSREQGFAWKDGKRTAAVAWLGTPLTPQDLNRVALVQSRVGAQTVLIFTPALRAPQPLQPWIQVLCGDKLVSWFSALTGLRPPVSGRFNPPNCDCGQPMEERVNRAGLPLFVCSRYPDCREMRQVTREERAEAAAAPATTK